MMLLPHAITLTRKVGLSSFGIALLCSGSAWLRLLRHARRSAWLAALLVLAEGFFFLDMIYGWRWLLHDRLQQGFEVRGLYGQRHWFQIACLVLLGVVLIFSFRAVLRKLRGRAWARLAACGLFLVIGCWCVEVISLHATDHVLYSMGGGMMTVAYLWVLASLLTAIGILADAGAR
jgi:uncharacterized membrane protein YhdT